MKTLKDINWNQVYSFYEVAVRLSMKEAAQYMSVATPTISEQIKKLEEVLGVDLFRRLPRRLELTEEGVKLFSCAKEMFEAGGRFLDTVSQDAIAGYPARIGILDSPVQGVSFDFVKEFSDAYQKYGPVHSHREGAAETLLEKLNQGKLDWIVTHEKPVSSLMCSKELAPVPLEFYISSGVAKGIENPLELFQKLPVLRRGSGRAINDSIDRALVEESLFPIKYLQGDYMPYCIDICKQGRAILPCDKRTVKDFGCTEELEAIPEFSAMIPMYVVWMKRTEKMNSVKKLLDLIETKGSSGSGTAAA